MFLMLSSLPLGLHMVWEYESSRERLRERSYEHLRTVREIKRREIENYLTKLREKTQLFAVSQLVTTAMRDFSIAFDELEGSKADNDQHRGLREYYQTELMDKLGPRPDTMPLDSLLPTDGRSVLLQYLYLAGSKSPHSTNQYYQLHEQYHHAITNFMQTYDLHDLFLIEDGTGYIVYSVRK
ncbi:MAG: hypothetical protein HC842_00590, partial [Cytophagales bacterium]|nr:hypothetical protein [Cytophagales bacterium]